MISILELLSHGEYVYSNLSKKMGSELTNHTYNKDYLILDGDIQSGNFITGKTRVDNIWIPITLRKIEIDSTTIIKWLNNTDKNLIIDGDIVSKFLFNDNVYIYDHCNYKIKEIFKQLQNSPEYYLKDNYHLSFNGTAAYNHSEKRKRPIDRTETIIKNINFEKARLLGYNYVNFYGNIEKYIINEKVEDEVYFKDYESVIFDNMKNGGEIINLLTY